MSCCDCLPDEGCADCDPAMARLRDDIQITQLIETLTRATLDIETGERQFPGTFAHLTIEDCDEIAACLERLRPQQMYGAAGMTLEDTLIALSLICALVMCVVLHFDTPRKPKGRRK